MAVNEKINSKSGKESWLVVVIVFILFIASLGAVVIGISKSEKGSQINSQEAFKMQDAAKTEMGEESLDELFRKEFTREVDNNGNYSNDPFREICQAAGDGGALIISSYTVCYR